MQEEEELSFIKKEVEKFIAKNKKKYEIITSLQKQLNSLTQDSYLQAIEFIEDNKSIFFNDHQSSVFFIYSVLDTSINNFKNLEVILDIFIHFSDELKRNISEIEILGLCILFINSINYLFMKGFFSISTIFTKSFQNDYLFINFLPEIEQYDKELVELRKKKILSVNLNEIKSLFYKTVTSDYQKHILNRNLNYHPSLLHKSIREDDIDTFQLLISQNNYNLNEPIQYSYYERTKTIDLNLTPIKVAAVYGSLKVFKFLMMNNADLSGNLLCYAYFGSNAEIIHLIEDKCSHDQVCIQPILTHNDELFEYYIENFEGEIKEEEEEEDIKKLVFNDNDNPYKVLNSDCLHGAVTSYHYPIITSCLERIIYVSRNFEMVEGFENFKSECFLFDSEFDYDFFKFIYSFKKPKVRVAFSGWFLKYLESIQDVNSSDVFKFAFLKLYDIINYRILLRNLVKHNFSIAIFILDFWIEKYDAINQRVLIEDLYLAVDYYNEDIVVKIIKLKPINFEDHIKEFKNRLAINISNKMISSLIKRISEFLPKETIDLIAENLII